jgi:hypothetical protein
MIGIGVSILFLSDAAIWAAAALEVAGALRAGSRRSTFSFHTSSFHTSFAEIVECGIGALPKPGHERTVPERAKFHTLCGPNF